MAAMGRVAGGQLPTSVCSSLALFSRLNLGSFCSQPRGPEEVARGKGCSWLLRKSCGSGLRSLPRLDSPLDAQRQAASDRPAQASLRRRRPQCVSPKSRVATRLFKVLRFGRNRLNGVFDPRSLHGWSCTASESWHRLALECYFFPHLCVVSISTQYLL